MQRTALPRSCRGYHREEAWLLPDAGYDAPQWSRLRRASVSTANSSSALLSELQPDLGDSPAPPRRTVFEHEPNKRRIPFSARQSGHKPRIHPFGECLRTVPGTASAHRVHGLDGSRTPQFLRGDCIAEVRLVVLPRPSRVCTSTGVSSACM